MDLPVEIPLSGDRDHQVRYLQHRIECCEREAAEALAGAQDGGALIFARLRRDDAEAIRRLIARQPR